MTKAIEVPSPTEKVKELEGLTVPELKDAIVTAYRRISRAEADKKYYSKSYGDVIKEEKEVIDSLVARLEFVMESDRVAMVKTGWLATRELGDKVEEIRDAIENGDADRADSQRGFRVRDEEADDEGGGVGVTADGEEFDEKTGVLHDS